MKKISEKILGKGNWLTLKETTYETKTGEKVFWESVTREKEAPGVVVLAQLIPSKRFVIVKQYRQALDAYILGFPSGLSDDDPEHALVELKEETGYIGKIVEISPVLKTNAGIVNDSGRVVYVHVDENDPANQNPSQELEPTEDIEVFLVAFDDVRDFVHKEMEQGTLIGANLWYLFEISQLIQK